MPLGILLIRVTCAQNRQLVERLAYELQRDRIYDQQGLPLEALQAMQTLAGAELAQVDVEAAYSLAQLRLHTALGNPIDLTE